MSRIFGYCPLPTWSELAGGVFGALRGARMPAATVWSRPSDTFGWLSHSAWSLALIAMWRQKLLGRNGIRVWIPAYFCNAALVPLRETGARLEFYPIDERGAPAFSWIKENAAKTSPDIVLFVHYFGEPNHSAALRDFCTRHRAWLVEDAAHVLRPRSSATASGDFVLYSPHKHLACPDGAVLVARTDGPGQLGTDGIAAFGSPESWSSQLVLLARTLRAQSADRASIVWVCKRVIQKFGIARHSRVMLTDHAMVGGGTVIGPEISRVAKSLISIISKHIAPISVRRSNVTEMWDVVIRIRAGGLVPTSRPQARAWTPYMAGYDGMNDVSTEAAAFAALGVPVSTWPDLPPEVKAAPELYASALALRRRRFFVAAHQSIPYRRIAALLPSSASVENEQGAVTVEWNQLDRSAWGALLGQCDRSNPLQSWEYGEAKRVEGWTPNRGVIHFDGRPVALMQTLEKGVLGVMRVVRLNRGPLFLAPVDLSVREKVWQTVGKLGKATSRRVLVAAIESERKGDALVALSRLGFHPMSRMNYGSMWLDLSPAPAAIRKQLDSKWRNMLSSAEKQGTNVEIGYGDDLLEWMFSTYATFRAAQGFAGPSPQLLRAWGRACVPNNQVMFVCRALQEQTPVSAVCIIRHGRDATYLLGWNSDAGRVARANYLLLWNALIELKRQGVAELDLGGISDDGTPGVAAFKRGLNGEQYELIGEFLKL